MAFVEGQHPVGAFAAYRAHCCRRGPIADICLAGAYGDRASDGLLPFLGRGVAQRRCDATCIPERSKPSPIRELMPGRH
jgi:hypothetical protein